MPALAASPDVPRGQPSGALWCRKQMIQHLYIYICVHLCRYKRFASADNSPLPRGRTSIAMKCFRMIGLVCKCGLLFGFSNFFRVLLGCLRVSEGSWEVLGYPLRVPGASFGNPWVSLVVHWVPRWGSLGSWGVLMTREPDRNFEVALVQADWPDMLCFRMTDACCSQSSKVMQTGPFSDDSIHCPDM